MLPSTRDHAGYDVQPSLVVMISRNQVVTFKMKMIIQVSLFQTKNAYSSTPYDRGFISTRTCKVCPVMAPLDIPNFVLMNLQNCCRNPREIRHSTDSEVDQRALANTTTAHP